ncbi:MAG: DNA repair protein RecN [Lachnospiraceae bacterium]|nr:DNA repair protein RecN [Lachnospiraceae bacterium]
MLLELHVRNLALIEKADVEFAGGLNILTGETGAGKSIIIGSVNMALGGKASKDSIRQGADNAYIELLFSVTDPEKRQALKALDVEPDEDGTLIISRKIMPSRSTSKINDETVTTSRLKAITGLLLDIHGQHEHQSLLHKSRHLEILDAYLNEETHQIKEQIGEEYRRYQALTKKLESFTLDGEGQIREADFCRFEIEEIEDAAIKEGEEEELALQYRRYSHSRKIMEGLSAAYEAVHDDGISRALREIDTIYQYDEEGLKNIRSQLGDLESLLSDAGWEISSYMENMTFDEETFRQIEERLDRIRGLMAKYGGTLDMVVKNLEEKKKRLEELENYDQARREVETDLEKSRHQLEKLCQHLSKIRKKGGEELRGKIYQALQDLNFINVDFAIEITRLTHFTANGFDEAEFKISANPGEPARPLKDVASGGELSRIMLAIKAVLADTDQIPTLIFDEIDTGISGRTAQKVSEKLSYIAKSHQVICITHLPQIAAMADSHFEIAKAAKKGRTATTIRRLGDEEAIRELARLLGGAEITEAVLNNAAEMKKLAEQTKQG